MFLRITRLLVLAFAICALIGFAPDYFYFNANQHPLTCERLQPVLHARADSSVLYTITPAKVSVDTNAAAYRCSQCACHLADP